MRLKIRSKTLARDFEFWAPDRGGYIRLEQGDNHGTLGTEICYGGGFRGYTISVNDEQQFRRECRTWYRQHIKNVTL
jgi:hypothetical protein